MNGARRRLPVPPALARWLGRSIANRIAAVAVAMAMVFVLVLAVSSYLVSRYYVTRGFRAQLAGSATAIAERFVASLESVHSDVGGLSRSTLVANGLVDSAGRASYLEPFLRDHSLPIALPFELGLADHTGRVLTSNRIGPQSYGTLPWWTQLLVDGGVRTDVRGGPDPRLVIAYAVVYRATGRPEGALVLELPMRALMEHAAAGVEAGNGVSFLFRGERLHVIDSSGDDASSDHVDASAAVRGGAVVPAGLEVIVDAPRSRMQRPLSWLGLVYAAFGVVVLCLAGVLASYAAQRIVAPLQVLSRTAEEVDADGKFAAPFEQGGEDEPAQLARALQRMVDGLRAARETLEARVAERTAELDFAQSRQRAIVDNMLEGLITIDEAGRIESFSRSAERIFGWSAADVVGGPLEVLMPEPHRSMHGKYMRRYFETGERKVIGVGREAEGLRRDGAVFPIELSVSELSFAGRHMFVGVVRDITERRRVDRMKSEFVSVVSHELRTPLTAVRGALGLLGGGVGGALSPQATELVRIALENGERLTRLIDDLLDVQRMEAGMMQFRLVHTPLRPLLETAIALNQVFAERLGVGLELAGTAPDVVVDVDPDRFQQVMANLLSNASKFSPRGATVTVRAMARARRVRIEVADHGPGIPEEFRDRLFQKFSQVDASSTRAREGTGLGLAIAKGLVERMAGTIGYDSVLGTGTTFYFDLPAQPTVAPVAKQVTM